MMPWLKPQIIHGDETRYVTRIIKYIYQNQLGLFLLFILGNYLLFFEIV